MTFSKIVFKVFLASCFLPSCSSRSIKSYGELKENKEFTQRVQIQRFKREKKEVALTGSLEPKVRVKAKVRVKEKLKLKQDYNNKTKSKYKQKRKHEYKPHQVQKKTQKSLKLKGDEKKCFFIISLYSRGKVNL